MGGMFSEISVVVVGVGGGGWVGGWGEDSMFCGSSVGGTFRGWSIFSMSCKNNLTILIWGHVHNMNSVTVAWL